MQSNHPHLLLRFSKACWFYSHETYSMSFIPEKRKYHVVEKRPKEQSYSLPNVFMSDTIRNSFVQITSTSEVYIPNLPILFTFYWGFFTEIYIYFFSCCGYYICWISALKLWMIFAITIFAECMMLFKRFIWLLFWPTLWLSALVLARNEI